MTPAQEEVKRLVERFKKYSFGSMGSDVELSNAKDCAIICVEEIESLFK